MFCVRSIYLNMPPIYLSIYIAYCDLHVNACICMCVCKYIYLYIYKEHLTTLNVRPGPLNAIKIRCPFQIFTHLLFGVPPTINGDLVGSLLSHHDF